MEKFDLAAFGEEAAKAELESRIGASQAILNDGDKLDDLLKGVEKVLKTISEIVAKLKNVEAFKKYDNAINMLTHVLELAPQYIDLLRNYRKGEYTDIPAASLATIVATLLYLATPFDVIPDTIPILGFLDDVAVLAVCEQMVKSDLDKYKEWLTANGKSFDI